MILLLHFQQENRLKCLNTNLFSIKGCLFLDQQVSHETIIKKMNKG